MFHRITAIAPLPEMRLLARFADGCARRYDVGALVSRMPDFQPLMHVPGLFERVSVDAGGYGVSWNDDIDLDANELWVNGEEVSTPFDGLLSFADATRIWQLSESTLRKAVHYKKLVDGVDVLKFGKQWIVTREAMLREYGSPS